MENLFSQDALLQYSRLMFIKGFIHIESTAATILDEYTELSQMLIIKYVDFEAVIYSY